MAPSAAPPVQARTATNTAELPPKMSIWTRNRGWTGTWCEAHSVSSVGSAPARPRRSCSQLGKVGGVSRNSGPTPPSLLFCFFVLLKLRRDPQSSRTLAPTSLHAVARCKSGTGVEQRRPLSPPPPPTFVRSARLAEKLSPGVDATPVPLPLPSGTLRRTPGAPTPRFAVLVLDVTACVIAERV